MIRRGQCRNEPSTMNRRPLTLTASFGMAGCGHCCNSSSLNANTMEASNNNQLFPASNLAMSGGLVHISNPILEKETDDHLHHFGITKSLVDIPKIFGDVKFVCSGGSDTRMKMYAEIFAKETGLEMSANLSKTGRYVMYKTGQVLWVNHGIGAPSLSIMLVELIKLLHYAKARDVIAIRMGTSGGLGVEPGTLVVSSGSLNGELLEEHVQYIMGKKVVRTAVLDAVVRDQLQRTAVQLKLPVEIGKTFAADDFYEGQARLDGAFCEYTAEKKFAFLNKLHCLGVRNIEMESTCFAAMLHRGNIRAAVVCVTLLNRLKGDQVEITEDTFKEFEMRTYKLVSTYIKQQLKLR